MTAFHFMLGPFFQIKALQAPFLPKFPLNYPKRTKQKHDLQKQKRDACTLILVPFL